MNNNLYVTDKGKLFFNYLKDMRDGKDYRVASFEDDIAEFGKDCNVSRNEMIELFYAAIESRLRMNKNNWVDTNYIM